MVMGFEMLITLAIKFNVLWDVKPCFLVRIYYVLWDVKPCFLVRIY
jgi:hypothetical protein